MSGPVSGNRFTPGAGRLLTVFQNRRWDSDYRTLRALMEEVLAIEPRAQVEYVSVADALSLPELRRVEGPALFSMAVAFVGIWFFSVTDKSKSAALERERFFSQFVRSQTGLGSSGAVAH